MFSPHLQFYRPCQEPGVSLHNNTVYYSAVFLFRDHVARFPPSPLCCLIFPSAVSGRGAGAGIFLFTFPHPALSQIGALGAFMPPQLRADRGTFGKPSALWPSLTAAPMAEGAMRCLLILRHVAKTSTVLRKTIVARGFFKCGFLSSSWLRALFPRYAEHSVIPQKPFGQAVSVTCQRAAIERETWFTGGDASLIRRAE